MIRRVTLSPQKSTVGNTPKTPSISDGKAFLSFSDQPAFVLHCLDRQNNQEFLSVRVIAGRQDINVG